MHGPGPSEWAQARQAAAELMTAYAGCQIRPVLRRRGVGLQVTRDPTSGGVCTAIGSVTEIRADLQKSST